MNLKNILKNLKLNENNISMLLGAAVIVVVGFLIVNYFKNLENGTTIPSSSTTADQTPATVKLPTNHTVSEGETLWSIAEKYYKSGYNWVDIQKANNLTNASVITKGQQLTIPDVAAKTATTTGSDLATATQTAQPVMTSASPSPVVTASPAATPKEETVATTKGGEPLTGTKVTAGEAISGDSYTVVHGDSLWKIAERAYGNGQKWTEIAQANKLLHPGTIHAGNVLKLPR
jgi:nucleoid-associated protein YgaU